MSSLELLLSRFDGKLVLRLRDFAGCTPWSSKTVRNRLRARGHAALPFAIFKVGKEICARTQDIAAWLDRCAVAPVAPPTLVVTQRESTRRGRPTHAERRQAAVAGLSVSAWRRQQVKGGEL